MAIPSFEWEGKAAAAVNVNAIRLRVNAESGDARYWAVYGRPIKGDWPPTLAGYQRLGVVPRNPTDATPLGEQLLWGRLSNLLALVGQDPAKWVETARPS
jgi:hypothetical protein